MIQNCLFAKKRVKLVKTKGLNYFLELVNISVHESIIHKSRCMVAKIIVSITMLHRGAVCRRAPPQFYRENVLCTETKVELPNEHALGLV